MPVVDPTHQHYSSQIIVDNTHTPIDPSGATPTLAEVLTAGDATNGVGSIDATSVAGYLILASDDSSFGGKAQVQLEIAQSGHGGTANLRGGNGAGGRDGGFAGFVAGTGDDGNGGSGGGVSGDGGAADGTGATVHVQGGFAGFGSGKAGGDVSLEPGVGDGGGRNGLVFLNLPTADPGVAGALYSDGAPSAGVPKPIMVSGG